MLFRHEILCLEFDDNHLHVAVAPGEPLILDEEGEPVKENMVGPYREGATIALDCIVHGGDMAFS